MEFTPANTSPLWEGTHLSKDALVRWRNHTLSPAQVVVASEHLAVCQRCRDQLASPSALLLLAQALDNRADELALVRELKLQHLNFEQMEAFVDELLTPAGRRNVERHLALCDVCSAQVADLRAVQSDLRDWQTSSQILPEPIVAASTTANGSAPHAVGAPESAPTFVPPPMRVVLPYAKEEKSRSSWWDTLRNVQRYLLPLETAGVAVIAVLLLFRPFQEQITPTASPKALADLDAALKRSQNQSKQSDAQIKQLRESVASLSKQSATTQQKVQQLAKDKAALSTQFNDTQSQLSAAQSKLEEAQAKLSALEEQRRRDLERSTQRPSTSSTSIAPRPTSLPSNPATSNFGGRILSDGPNASILISQDGRAVRAPNGTNLPADALRLLSQGLPDSVKELSESAPVSKSAETQIRIHLLSPVATRVREVGPVLHWEAVHSATHYRVTLTDDTDETDIDAPYWNSDLLTKLQWQPPESLTRGHRYSWRVEALKQDPNTGMRRSLGEGPRKPDLIATFEILTQAQEDALRAQLETFKDSPLQKSVVLAKAGVLDEARKQLSLVTDSKIPLALKSP